MNKKMRPLFGVITTMLIGVLLGININYIKNTGKNTPENTEQALQIISTPFYYPKKLPNYYVIKNQYSSDESIKTYSIVNKNNNFEIAVTIQPKPDAKVIDKFNTETLALPESVKVSNGNLTIGQARGKYIASYTLDKSWLLVTSPLGIDYYDFVSIVSSFEK